MISPPNNLPAAAFSRLHMRQTRRATFKVMLAELCSNGKLQVILLNKPGIHRQSLIHDMTRHPIFIHRGALAAHGALP